MSDGCISASFKAFLHGSIVFSTKCEIKFSNLALVNVILRCFGPAESAVIKGRFISVCIAVDNSHFAFSAPSFNLCNAIASFFKSIESDF